MITEILEVKLELITRGGGGGVAGVATAYDLAAFHDNNNRKFVFAAIRDSTV